MKHLTLPLSDAEARSLRAGEGGLYATAQKPPRRAASRPLWASSTTAQRAGGRPSAAAALRNTSGSGLLRETMPPSTTASSSGARASLSMMSGALRLEEATASFTPRRRSSESVSRAPGSASAGVRRRRYCR